MPQNTPTWTFQLQKKFRVWYPRTTYKRVTPRTYHGKPSDVVKCMPWEPYPPPTNIACTGVHTLASGLQCKNIVLEVRLLTVYGCFKFAGENGRVECEVKSRATAFGWCRHVDDDDELAWCCPCRCVNHGQPRYTRRVGRNNDRSDLQWLQWLVNVASIGRHVARYLGNEWRHVDVTALRQPVCTSASTSSLVITCQLDYTLYITLYLAFYNSVQREMNSSFIVTEHAIRLDWT